MITPELLGYIRAELAKGRSREAIHNDLIHGGGWMVADIDEAFREIVPPPVQQQVPPEPQPFAQFQPQPIAVQPVAAFQPVETAQPIAVVQPGIQQSIQKKRPYLLQGFLLTLFSIIILIVGIGSNATLQAKLSGLPSIQSVLGFLIPILLVVEFAIALLLSWVLHVATKIIKGIEPSWHKAVFSTGVSIAIGTVVSVFRLYVPLAGLLSLLLFILLFGIQITILSKTYSIRPVKAFVVGLIQGILFTIVIVVLALIFGAVAPTTSTPSFNQAQPNTPSKTLLFQQ